MEKTNRHAHGKTAQELITKIQEAGFKARSYSRRCMFGKRCVGVVVGFDEDDWGIPRGNQKQSAGFKSTQRAHLNSSVRLARHWTPILLMSVVALQLWLMIY